MKIVHLIPGAGTAFYCENCVRDLHLIKALRALGHDVILAPMYFPFSTDPLEVRPGTPLFFGGINVWLQQKSPLFRKTPRWIDNLFNAAPLLRLAARGAGSTRARTLGETTRSMLLGEDGRQAKELEYLSVWLRAEKPDVVHLSNLLLAGVAPHIKNSLGIPVVCSLQDEHTWIDPMVEPDRSECRRLLRARAADIAAFTAVSGYYRDRLRDTLELPAEKMHVVPPGLAPEDYPEAPLAFDPQVIGFLSRMSELHGLGVLAEAFLRLRENPRHAPLRLRVAGGATADDGKFLRRVRRRLAEGNALGNVDFLPGFDRTRRLEFLRSLSVLSVPGAEIPAFGVYALEAMAAGVPVVLPRAGAFPELIEPGGGGILYEPKDSGALVEALNLILTDPVRAHDMGRAGRRTVINHYSAAAAAKRMMEIYKAVI
ncbi:MAG: glycosyltransferase family 4 protein [Planctomycetota bacterium]